jgi:hypothetical protein
MAYREDRRYLFGPSRPFCYHCLYNKNDDIPAAPPMVKPAGLNLDVLRPRRSPIADDRVERPEFSCRSMRSSKTRRPVTSRNAIKQPEFATRRPRCDARVPTNQQLVFIELRGALMRANSAGMPTAVHEDFAGRKWPARSKRSTIWVAAWIVRGWWVKPGLGEMKAAISRARSSCLSDASAGNEITRFSSAITRTRSCTNSAFVSSGTSDCASSEIWPSWGP